jgi:hypothetical protein
MLSAVVTTIGSVGVPPIKPFNDLTGPENVVNAMIDFPSYKVKLISLVCVCRGSLISRNIPGFLDITLNILKSKH